MQISFALGQRLADFLMGNLQEGAGIQANILHVLKKCLKTIRGVEGSSRPIGIS